jgi:hypothetical protein
VAAIAREGAAPGGKEAMVTLASVRATVIRVLEETGLLTHLNPGVMSWQDFRRRSPCPWA